MDRREFIRAAGAGTATAAAWPSSAARARDDRPNILFIMTDQQHAGMMSCAGNRWLKTPALDSLAASGIRFERAYACNPVCVPNRFSLQSGHMPSAVGIGQNGDGRTAEIPDTIRLNTLGWLFNNAGYEAVYGGKTHVPAKIAVPANGYNYFCRDSRQELADTCADFIRQPHDRPFFLFASFINPHDICYMGINDEARAKGGKIRDNVDSKTVESLLGKARAGDVREFVGRNCPPLPDNLEVPDNEPQCITEKYVAARSFRKYCRENWPDEMWRLHRWAYCRLTEMVDAKIGRILDAVRDAGIADNTLIVFTSDHGDMDGAHRMEHKSVLYDEAVRIPYIMSYKGVIPEAAVDDAHLVSNGLDLLPTLCDYAGIRPPEGLQGASLRPLAEGKAPKARRDYVACESQNGRMMRTERFKYCVYDSGEHREQLTDLRNDPGEMTNLADDPAHRDVLAEHRRHLRQWVDRAADEIGAKYII